MTRSNVVRFAVSEDECVPSDPVALQAQIQDLQRALLSLPLIEQAKGVVMQQFRVDAETAFAVLDRVSQDTNIKIREIAALVCEASCGQLRPRPGTNPVLAHVLDQLSLVPDAGTGDTAARMPAKTGRPPPRRPAT